MFIRKTAHQAPLAGFAIQPTLESLWRDTKMNGNTPFYSSVAAIVAALLSTELEIIREQLPFLFGDGKSISAGGITLLILVLVLRQQRAIEGINKKMDTVPLLAERIAKVEGAVEYRK